MRAYLEKPRTNVGWKGYLSDPDLNGSCDINKGLANSLNLYNFISDLGLPFGAEILDPFAVPYFAEYLSWACIGARTAESQIHRQIASDLSSAVGIKNNTDGNIDLAINAIKTAQQNHRYLGLTSKCNVDIINTTGNNNCHLVLRGGKNAPNFSISNINQATRSLLTNLCNSSIIIDCSHGNSNYSYERQSMVLKDIIEQRKSGNKSIIGFMLESNIKPGKQNIPAIISNLQYGVSITDACIGFKETTELIKFVYNNI